MRRAFAFALVFVAVAVLVAGPVLAGCGKDCKCCSCKVKCDKEITEFIYDVTFPWPFRQKVKDMDGDGVPDKLDKCPGTPLGAKVDEYGCPMDSDGDGIFDGLDKCPDTPKGAKVDKFGCSTDSDGDGVSDGIDKCPDTPKGVMVDTVGCPIDSDGDGVFDGLDKCPDTPKGAKVDGYGCPIDTDGDGVPDGIDRCPNTPSGITVDAYGCTAAETQFLDTGLFTTSDVKFASSKADINPASYPVLDRIAEALVQWPQLRIEIGGHTDSSGSAEFNQKLSEQRAQAVLDYMAKNSDIEKGQFTSKGYGEAAPIVSNDTTEGRAKNRRVEFKILNKEVLKK